MNQRLTREMRMQIQHQLARALFAILARRGTDMRRQHDVVHLHQREGNARLVLEDIQRRILSRLLDRETGLIPEARAALRSRLGMPAEIATPPTPPASGTNNPAPPASTP